MSSRASLHESFQEGSVLFERYRLQKRCAIGPGFVSFEACVVATGEPVTLELFDPVRRTRTPSTPESPDPRFPTVQGRGMVEGFDYVVMSRVRGSALSNWLSRAMPVRHAVALTLAVVDAVMLWHTEGKAHGALHPARIFVELDEHGGWRVEVLPGAVCVAGFDWESENTAIDDRRERFPDLPWRRLPAEVQGAEGYTAPEVLLGLAASPQTDVFALATILLELLLGTPPFAAETREELAAHLLTDATPAPLEEPGSEALSRVIVRALHQSPGQRYSTAWEFRRGLEAGFSELPEVQRRNSNRPTMPDVGDPLERFALFEPGSGLRNSSAADGAALKESRDAEENAPRAQDDSASAQDPTQDDAAPAQDDVAAAADAPSSLAARPADLVPQSSIRTATLGPQNVPSTTPPFGRRLPGLASLATAATEQKVQGQDGTLEVTSTGTPSVAAAHSPAASGAKSDSVQDDARGSPLPDEADAPENPNRSGWPIANDKALLESTNSEQREPQDSEEALPAPYEVPKRRRALWMAFPALILLIAIGWSLRTGSAPDTPAISTGDPVAPSAALLPPPPPPGSEIVGTTPAAALEPLAAREADAPARPGAVTRGQPPKRRIPDAKSDKTAKPAPPPTPDNIGQIDDLKPLSE
jgi:serine/threonine protein kinase